MRLQRRRPADSGAPPAGTIVVMDVLRMTSTAAVLMRRPSCERLAVAATLDDLERLPQPPRERVVVSELVGAARPETWVDSSPARVAGVDFGGRTPVLVTTNGTRALFAAAARADRVLLACFLDLRAVARHLASAARVELALMPAGHVGSGEERIEDELCADALESLLAGPEPDLAGMASTIRAHHLIRRRLAAEPGFAADLDAALDGAPCSTVLELRPLDAGVGYIVRSRRA